MKYRSSRGGHSGASFEEVLFAGYAPDGGIYVPESIPSVPTEFLSEWKTSPPKYKDVVFEIVKLFVDEEELPRDVLQNCIDGAYAEFDVESLVGLHDCVGGENGALNYTAVEMFHGKTKSFKDYALSLVGRLMEHFVKKRGSHVTVLVGTSGDTGSAAIEAVKGLQGIDIIVLYPKGKISEMQELQMITVMEENVHVFATEGNSDELDIPIKKSFPASGLVSINSINWARIMIQVSHHVYLCTLEHCQPVDIYVPTGGAGNLTSGMVASLLGFPLNLYCAQNVNDTVATLINKGQMNFSGDVQETFSNAMDIRIAYNTERMLYFLSDCQTVDRIMKSVENEVNSPTEVPETAREKLRHGSVKGAMTVDTTTTLKMIADCWNANKYLICPHTATAVAFFHSNNQLTKTSNKVYVVATASPEKFPDAAKAAKISDQSESKFLIELRARQRKEPKQMKKSEDWYKILQEEINSIRKSIL